MVSSLRAEAQAHALQPWVLDEVSGTLHRIVRPEFEDGVCPVCRDDDCPFGHDHDRRTTWRGPAACLDDAPHAAIAALFGEEPDAADQETWHWLGEPTVRNLSAHEHDQAALAAWHAGTPIPGGMVTSTDLLTSRLTPLRTP